MRLYDTRTRAVVEIIPSTRAMLRMYCCGPTVYRDAHVGNLRTFLLGDLIRRVAEAQGWRVRVVQNITDVGHLEDDTALDALGEDKLLAEARRTGRDALEIARHYEDRFHADLAALNVRPVDLYPRASESIPLMLDLVRRLVDKGNAYVADNGSVFFDAASFESYGEISGNRLEQLRPGHRFEGTIDENKRFHADWTLWKAADPARRELVWDSPWGYGFPGWHVECSALLLQHLGEDVDVHVGGIDLRFPHHEDERAQSNAAVGHEVVRHWVHGEHLLFEGRKMAKSTRNVVLLSDVVHRGHDPLALRLAFLEHRYRQQMNLTWAAIGAADRTMARWRERVAEWAEASSQPIPSAYLAEVYEAFADDLDTPAALQALRRLEKDTEIPAGAKFEAFAHLDRLLGLDLARDVGKPKEPAVLPAEVTELLDARAAARATKNWAESDRLRDELATHGVKVIDTLEGQRVE